MMKRSACIFEEQYLKAKLAVELEDVGFVDVLVGSTYVVVVYWLIKLVQISRKRTCLAWLKSSVMCRFEKEEEIEEKAS